jgi:DNA-binding PadR family transcriptional regulator
MELTVTEYAVLGLLSEGERSGYDLVRDARRSIGFFWAPAQSHVYRVLPRLVDRDLAVRRVVAQATRPDKQVYRLTAAGQDELRRWLETVDEEPAGGSGVWLLKLFFGAAAAGEAADAQLAAYRRSLEQRLAFWEELERGLVGQDDPVAVHQLVVLRHGLTRARATLGWVDESRAALAAARRAPTADGRS